MIEQLAQALQRHPLGGLCIAFSGGPDSSALLHVLAQLPEARARGLRALHVDHGLHAASGDWAAHCREFCETLQLPCEVRRVTVPRDQGLGLEAAARQARYQALGTALKPGESLLLGHHRDDQCETILLKLLRGAGPEGLGGMRALRPFAAGWLWRPLLDMPRDTLREYLAMHAINGLDDPSNTDTRLARNHLRRIVWPHIEERFPHAAAAMLHSAALCRAAADSLREHWLPAFAQLHDAMTGSLDVAGWLNLSPALRAPLLDHWLHTRGRTAPGFLHRREIERQCQAREGRVPCINWPGTELHIWKGRLWALAPACPADPTWQVSWSGEPLQLPGGGYLQLSKPRRLPHPLTVRWRRGGERIRPAGDRHTRELRDLFQQAAMPPWQRACCPLIFDGACLLAVADRWHSAEGQACFHQLGALPEWLPAR